MDERVAKAEDQARTLGMLEAPSNERPKIIGRRGRAA